MVINIIIIIIIIIISTKWPEVVFIFWIFRHPHRQELSIAMCWTGQEDPRDSSSCNVPAVMPRGLEALRLKPKRSPAPCHVECSFITWSVLLASLQDIFPSLQPYSTVPNTSKCYKALVLKCGRHPADWAGFGGSPSCMLLIRRFELQTSSMHDVFHSHSHESTTPEDT